MTFAGKEFLVIFFSSLVFLANCTERDMTVSVPPGREECFYETLRVGQTLDIDYQVIDGGQGELDISFHLTSPNDRIIIVDYKKPEQSHRHEVAEDGDYKMCFDNRFSNFNSKTVYFEIMIDSDEEEDPWDDLNGQTPEQQYEMAIQDIEEVVKRVKGHLFKIRHMQESVRAFAARDKHIADGNFFRVNSWSILQIIVMLLVGFVQVVMVKSLFDEQSKIHKIWKSRYS
ncbi:UNVERIFIED_CONTAM: hypothetical protein PYX00_004476 [Menopon gallinae]|uniref:GOLD domain-containing protein n=1 Tax=Menopon gallinae TaxID=328185 RepID=A0AAW2I4J0_9NEOP